MTCCRANGGECIKQMLRRNLHLNKALQSKCLERVPRQHCLKVKVEIRKKSVEGGWEERGGVEHCDATYVLCIVLVDGTVDRNFPRLCRRRRWRWARHFVCLFYDPWTKGLKPVVLEPGRGSMEFPPISSMAFVCLAAAALSGAAGAAAVGDASAPACDKVSFTNGTRPGKQHVATGCIPHKQ